MAAKKTSPGFDFIVAALKKNPKATYKDIAAAARFLGLSERTLEKHRTYGTGPAYRKIGGRVVYTIEELRAWCDRGACASTSDPNNGSVLTAVRRPGDTAEHR